MFTVNFANFGSGFAIPVAVVDRYLKMASFCAVKSLLWIYKNQGGSFTCEEIAAGIGSSAADTKEALDYWVNEGLLIDTDKGADAASPVVSDSHLKKEDVKQPVKETEKTADKIKLKLPTYKDFSTRTDEDKNFSGLVNQVQIMLGRSVGHNLGVVLLMMYDVYGIDEGAICTLIQFCIDRKKTSDSYIKSIAERWHKDDILTLDDANRYVTEHKDIDSVYAAFAMDVGLSASKPTPNQEEFFVKWNKMGFTVQMMVLAYNEAVDYTGKTALPAFRYADTVLENWNRQGFKTPEDVEKGRDSFKKVKEKEDASKRSYDIDKAKKDLETREIVFKKKKKRGENN
ncbi:MAG: DnaD domain protein [Ruminococcaceae bacterium]|nr:DnaD domain protein [Oscillospiraceae bacterium]